METESVTLDFTPEAIDRIATLAEEVNQNVENIGARRLHTILEKLMEDISFDAPDLHEKSLTITAEDVQNKVGSLAQNADLSKFIL
jgi:ATP-dependent HslUV protease ATP-binding subunit HslU